MERAKTGAEEEATATTANYSGEEDNPNSRDPEMSSAEDQKEQEQEHEPGSRGVPPCQSTRTPFTDLSQVEADLALARTLQEQERAYMMLRMNGEESDYGSWEVESHEHNDDDDSGDPNDSNETDENDNEYDDGADEVDEVEEVEEVDDDEDAFDAFDAQAHANANYDYNPSTELDSSAFSSDESFARALQDAEDQELAARMLAIPGINDGEFEDTGDHGDNSQDTWQEIDPDELSYEELLALGEVVGTENRGMTADKIASLPSLNYKASNSRNGTNDSCVICRLDYEDGDTLTVLYCKHSYHTTCLDNWLRIKKVCPVCSAEATTSAVAGLHG